MDLFPLPLRTSLQKPENIEKGWVAPKKE